MNYKKFTFLFDQGVLRGQKPPLKIKITLISMKIFDSPYKVYKLAQRPFENANTSSFHEDT